MEVNAHRHKLFLDSKKSSLSKRKKERVESSSGIGEDVESVSEKESPASLFEEVFFDSSPKEKDFIFQVGELVKEMDIIGERLKRNASLKDFLSYKKVLKNIFLKTISSTYNVETSYSRPSFHKPVSKELRIVKVVNESLDSLLKMIKLNQRQNISIASSIVQIKGLIVNLLK